MEAPAPAASAILKDKSSLCPLVDKIKIAGRESDEQWQGKAVEKSGLVKPVVELNRKEKKRESKREVVKILDRESFHTSELDSNLELRFQSLKCRLQNKVIANNYLVHSGSNGSTSKKVCWADTTGSSLTHINTFSTDDPPLTAGYYDAPYSQNECIYRSKDNRWSEEQSKRTRPPAPLVHKKTYRDTLLSPAPPSLTRLPTPSISLPSSSTKPAPRFFKGRCFRCLGRDHRAAHCRDPIRCARCFKVGHKARYCKHRLPMNVNRAMRARPSYLSAFVLLLEDFFTRQKRRRNAILVEVAPLANLGHFAQETVAGGLARRFGGYSTDFLVARFSERDFVIFLPEWVQSDFLIRRELISLGEIRLRCFPWNLYAGARRAPFTYRAWIRVVGLPYECWSSRSVAALVSGFGRFLRADDFSSRMADLSGYRCLIAVNHLHDILENLEITFGAIFISCLIQLERWGREDEEGRGNPPPPNNERSDHHDPHERPLKFERRFFENAGGRRSTDGAASNIDGAWDSSEIRDRRRTLHAGCFL